MAKDIYVEGLDECLKMIDSSPEQLMKLSRTAVRKAAQVTVRYLKGRTPSRWKKLMKYKVGKSLSGRVTVTMGAYNGGQTSGHQNPSGERIPDWFKAYWINYGTLEGRDTSHHFQTKVKHRAQAASQRRKSRQGIKARNFFESAIQGWEDKFLEAFNKNLDIDKIK